MTTLDDVVAVLESGSRDEVISTLSALSDKDRKSLGSTFRGWLTRGWTAKVSAEGLAVAIVATATGPRQALAVCDVEHGATGDLVTDVVEVLGTRRPSWLPEFVDGLLRQERTLNWRLARAVVRRGLVPVPDNPEYYRGTVRGAARYDLNDPRPLVDELDGDPTLVEDHLLAMLGTEGVGRLLAYHDGFYDKYSRGFTAGTWRSALTTLSQQGRLDRGALLDAVLAAPLRDWPQVDVGWYVDLHETLDPTVEEVVARQLKYIRLLTAEHGPSVKAAQRQLARILEDPRLEPTAFVEASRTTLGRSDKSSVTSQLKLLDRLRSARPDIVVVETIRIAAEHPRADVREHATRLLARLGAATDEPPPAPPFQVPVSSARPEASAVEPVADADELADVLLSLLEGVDPILTERAIDGLLRLAHERPRAGDVLLQRAMSSDFWGGDPSVVPALLTRAWLGPATAPNDPERPVILGYTWRGTAAAPDTIIGFLGRRLTAVVQQVRVGRSACVALPSTSDGNLDADLLNQRLTLAQRQGLVPSELELAVALLRVPPADRPDIVVPADARGERLRRRLLDTHQPVWERQVHEHRPMSWRPATSIPLFADLAAGAGDALGGVLSRRHPKHTLGQEVSYGEDVPRFDEVLGLAALLLPHELDVLAAHAHPFLHRDLRKDRAMSVPVIDAISRARTPIGAPQSSALVLALAAKDARGRVAAQDALVDLARHGLLDGGELGRQAALHLNDDIIVGQRLAAGLIEVARVEDATVMPVLDALSEVMPALPGRAVAATFVELAADLGQRTGRRPDLPQEFRDMAAGKSTSRLAKAARRLL